MVHFRFRGYIRALLCSVRAVCCQPGSLFRSHSKSSLDIGVVPVDRRRGGAIMKMELQHHTNNQAVRAARACGGGQRTRGTYCNAILQFFCDVIYVEGIIAVCREGVACWIIFLPTERWGSILTNNMTIMCLSEKKLLWSARQMQMHQGGLQPCLVYYCI